MRRGHSSYRLQGRRIMLDEVSADKAYNLVDNYNAVQRVGGTAYMPFKSNATGQLDRTNGNRARLWHKMF